MNNKNPGEKLIPFLVGSEDFCRQFYALLNEENGLRNITSGNYIDAWGKFLTHRPNLLIIEIGIRHDAEKNEIVRNLLQQIRERLKERVFIVLYSAGSESFSYIGDLFFENIDDTAGSGLIDALLFAPPPYIATAPSIKEQIMNLINLVSNEMRKRDGGHALPCLNSNDWIQSQADPLSRELWMRWIPRYATYVNESPLIIGETGSGKTKVAYALHKLSGRSGKFVSITPRDFSSSELIQAELFGAVAGAYTGAVDKWGLVKSAEKGTLFIDELQSIDKDLQGKLITFIEDKVYRRVGSAESIAADVRFVFASNKSIEQMIQDNILREDFAYRLERLQVKVPALKERRLDIAAALAYALGKIHRLRPIAKSIRGFTASAYRILFCHNWPGNLRQLENIVAQLCDLAEIEGDSLINEYNVIKLLGAGNYHSTSQNVSEVIAAAASEISQNAYLHKYQSLQESIDRFSQKARLKALEVSQGDFEKAAQLIKDDRTLIMLTAQNVLSKSEQ